MRAPLLALLVFSACAAHGDWRTASRESVGLAPLPSKEPRAVVQVYAARTYGWRRYFGVHSWIATKEKGADSYVTYHVIGWRARSGQSVVAVEKDIPDRAWYGSKPELVSELFGEAAEAAIPRIRQAAQVYPYPHTYRVWPGPNSNTFVSFILRRVPELGVELPPTAIGKDWINDGDLFGYTETGTGVQVSVLGSLGFTLGLSDGVEANVLGLSFGLDLLRPAIKLPFVGRLGFSDKPL